MVSVNSMGPKRPHFDSTCSQCLLWDPQKDHISPLNGPTVLFNGLSAFYET